MGALFKSLSLENYSIMRVQGLLTFPENGVSISRSLQRALHLSDETMLLMKRHKMELAEKKLRLGKDWIDNDLVFPNAEGRPMQSRWDNTLWKRTLSKAKVNHRRLHDARHTAATMLYNDDTDIEVIRRFLGHSSVELTSRTYCTIQISHSWRLRAR